MAVVFSVMCSYLDLFSILYMIPVIVVSALYRDGRRLLPASCAGLIVVAIILMENRKAFGTDTGKLAILIALFIPVVLWVSAMLWIGLDGKRFLTRYLASVLFGVFASVFLVLAFSRQQDATKVLDSYFSRTFVQLFQELAGNGEQNAINTTQLTALYHMAVQVMGAFLAPMSMFFCLMDAFVASCIQQKGSDSLTKKVLGWHLPQDWIWAFLGSWLAVAFGYFRKWPYTGMAVALNLAGSVSVLFALQGFAILLFKLRKRHETLGAGKLFVWIVLMLMFLPGVNMVVVVALPIMGVLETWFEFRRIDKEISYENHS